MSSSWNRSVTQAGGLSSSHGEALFRHAGSALSASPADRLALQLFCDAFGWTASAQASHGPDARDEDGQRYCVRGGKVNAFDTACRLSPIKGLANAPFEFLAAAMFDAHDHLLHAAILPASLIPEIASFDRAKNVHIVHFTDSICADARVRNVTGELQAV